jgi:hypothetical protein
MNILEDFTSRISIYSSSKSSVSSATSVSKIIDKLNLKTIASCIIGISKINFLSGNLKDVSHSALLLLDTQSEADNEEDEGILIEYGDYSPNMSEKEKEYVQKGKVKYRYGDKGGLRYYAKKFQDFLNEFANLGHIELDIDTTDQKTFDTFIVDISPENQENWTQSKYAAFSHNCQTFVVEAIKNLNPKFQRNCVYPKDQKLMGKKSKKVSFIPSQIMDELKKHEHK